MTPIITALLGTYGAFLIVTALLLGWVGIGFGPRHHRSTNAALSKGPMALRRWLDGTGLDRSGRHQLVAVSAVASVVTSSLVVAVFGALAPALAVGVGAAFWPVSAAHSRYQRRQRLAAEAWPRLISEIGMLAGSLGSSIPQALFEVGRRSPAELQPAFAAAQRHWVMSTDLTGSLAILTAQLADPTADAACETLLVAHEVGGNDVGRRLAALAEDRVADLDGRKEAAARQAGARFARRFVLFVPLGMALAGLSIGDGRTAYRGAAGQVAALIGVGMVAACWLWSGRIMRLPGQERVFGGETRMPFAQSPIPARLPMQIVGGQQSNARG